MRDFFDQLKMFLHQGFDCALCTIVETHGSTPLKTGAKMIVKSNGDIFGTIGGGDLEKSIIEQALVQIKLQQSEQFKHNLLQQHGMCCGGSVTVFIDFIPQPEKLYIFGAGHVGRALATLASHLQFDVFLIDERRNELDKITNQKINKLPYSHREILSSLPFSKSCFITIMTRDHGIDREILSQCISKTRTYLGMIGSKRKVEITRKMFISGGICTEEEFNEVCTPMGININAHDPEEIAISILAEIIQYKNKRKPSAQKVNHKIKFQLT